MVSRRKSGGSESEARIVKLAGVFSRLIISTWGQFESEGKDRVEAALNKNKKKKIRAK
jgi:hypothetical protein